ncbi:Glycosyltransferase involved in cell wall bisynthesis [Desulfofundulus thermosubterraneus DSM 16057]|uniref:Glycosyltransferase involved in cell wall bisynthesis n=1 Tax=Desulfofundulus thermosubterraneus DSM 16057 TaxID=1121432 RepID=A0A1M6FT81_9FIRM|nr:Glycosyltransferase involved in cell wall bisynthesis [Desulfofundulus thermosubterraneus DSM 16057]
MIENSSIAILLPSLSSGDAIGNDVLEEYKLLRQRGARVYLYAEYYEPQFAPLMASMDQVKNVEAIIYHHGIEWPAGEKLLNQHMGSYRFLRYHNVTPPQFFAGYSAELEKLVKRGREQTRRLIKLCTHFLADSRYNCEELISEGAPPDKCLVVAPFHQADELLSLQADIRTLESLLADARPIILFVGRQAPNKGLHHFVRVARSLLNLYSAKFRFIWVGGRNPQLAKYYREVENYLAANRLLDLVTFPGKVSQTQLKAFYMAASVFLTLSEHEGFCVPIIEAQAVGVPVVALGRAAVSETTGENQLIFEELDYERFATAVAVLLANPDYRLHLASHGKNNYHRRFAWQVLEAAFLGALGGVYSS